VEQRQCVTHCCVLYHTLLCVTSHIDVCHVTRCCVTCHTLMCVMSQIVVCHITTLLCAMSRESSVEHAILNVWCVTSHVEQQLSCSELQ